MEIKLSDFTYRSFSSGTQSWVHRGKTRVWEVLCFWNCASQQKLSKLSCVSLPPLKLVLSPKFILPLKNQFLAAQLTKQAQTHLNPSCGWLRLKLRPLLDNFQVYCRLFS